MTLKEFCEAINYATFSQLQQNIRVEAGGGQFKPVLTNGPLDKRALDNLYELWKFSGDEMILARKLQGHAEPIGYLPIQEFELLCGYLGLYRFETGHRFVLIRNKLLVSEEQIERILHVAQGEAGLAVKNLTSWWVHGLWIPVIMIFLALIFPSIAPVLLLLVFLFIPTHLATGIWMERRREKKVRIKTKEILKEKLKENPHKMLWPEATEPDSDKVECREIRVNTPWWPKNTFAFINLLEIPVDTYSAVESRCVGLPTNLAEVLIEKTDGSEWEKASPGSLILYASHKEAVAILHEWEVDIPEEYTALAINRIEGKEEVPVIRNI